jgi:hypothetical protein
VVSDATAQAIIQAPVALLGTLFATPGGAASAFSIARTLSRNFPLVLLLVMIGALFWPTKPLQDGLDETDDIAPKPNGSDTEASVLRH